MTKPQLIICGSIAIDRIMNFSGSYQDLIHRKKLDVLSISVLLDGMEVARGGVGANIAYSLAQLGEKPILLGSVGKDAAQYINMLSQAGVDVTHIHTSQLPTASFNVMTDSNHNQIGGFYPGAMADSISLSLEPWAIQNVFMCLSAHDPVTMHAQVEQCRNYKIRLMYDPGQQVNNVAGDDLLKGITAAEVLIINEYEHSLLCEKTKLTASELRAKMPLLIITRGDQGSIIDGTSLKKPLTIKVAQPAKLVDPTGAGDSYRAGFLYGYLRQWDLTKCGNLGSVMASLVLEQFGTQCHVSSQAVKARYQEAFQAELTL